MGAFIVPRAQKTHFVPTITLEEISNVLVLYLSSVMDYVHATAEIACDPDARRTTLILQGQIDPRLERRVGVRATIEGRTAPSFATRIWADPFVVRIVSEDLGLDLDLMVEPQSDRTIAITRVKDSGDARTGAAPEDAAAVPTDDAAAQAAAPLQTAADAQVESTASDDNSFRLAESAEADAPEPDANDGGAINSTELAGERASEPGLAASQPIATEGGEEVVAAELAAAETESKIEAGASETDAVVAPVADLKADENGVVTASEVEETKAEADIGPTEAETEENSESARSGDDAALEPAADATDGAEIVSSEAEIAAGEDEAVVEMPAELVYADVEAPAGTEASAADAKMIAVVEELTERPIVGEAPIDVTFAGLEEAEAGDDTLDETIAGSEISLVTRAGERESDHEAEAESVPRNEVESESEREIGDEATGSVVVELASEIEVTNPEPADADVGKEDDEEASALSVPEPSVAHDQPTADEPINADSETKTQIETQAEKEPIASAGVTALSSQEDAADGNRSGEVTFATADVDDDHRASKPQRVERPITIAGMLSDDEELVIELRTKTSPVTLGESESVASDGISTSEEQASDAVTEAPAATRESDLESAEVRADDEGVKYTAAGDNASDESGAEAAAFADDAEFAAEAPSTDAAADKGVAADDLMDDERDLTLGRSKNFISGDVIASMTEEAVFGPGQKKRCAVVKGDNSFAFSIVGEAHYQSELDRMTIGRERKRGRVLLAALLVPEPGNFFDKYAVAVQINRQTVGYLTFEAGPLLLKVLAEGGFDCAACAAAIIGGEEDDDGAFTALGVKLDAVMPFVLSEAEQVEPVSHTARAA